MKLLRFRSFSDRKSIAAFLLLAAAGSPALASSSTVEEVKAKIAQECDKEPPESVRIFEDRERGRYNPIFDPAVQCEANGGEELESHNSRAISADLVRKHPEWLLGDRREDTARKLGACRKNYKTMKDAHDRYFLVIYSQYCKQLKLKMDEAVSCGDPSKRCEPKYKAVKDIFARYTAHATEFGESMKKYLALTAKASAEAARRYEADLKILDGEYRRRSTTAGEQPVIESLDSHPLLKPANGNKQMRNLREYYEALSGFEQGSPAARNNVLGQPHGRLITEHKEAEKRASKFAADLDSLVAESSRLAKSSAERWESMLAGIDRNGPADKNNPISKIATYTPAITGATALTGQMLGNQQGPAAAITAASAGGPSLAAIGAAAAAGAALSSGFGASASREAPAESVTPQAPASTFVPTAVAKLDDTDTAKGGGPSLGNELPAGNNPKVEGGKVDSDGAPAAAFPAFGAGEGTSRMISGSKRGAKGPTSVAATADAGLGEEGLSNFGSRGMDPKPGPKGAALSPGAEVANLLGQMKDLFNFDEGAGMGPGPDSSGPGLGPDVPLDPNMAGTVGGEEPGAEAPDEEGAQAEAGETGVPAQAAEMQGAQFGRADTTLFKRVRQRHTRCMERGLVLYQLGERVE